LGATSFHLPSAYPLALVSEVVEWPDIGSDIKLTMANYMQGLLGRYQRMSDAIATFAKTTKSKHFEFSLCN
jgi:hypothetical protein